MAFFYAASLVGSRYVLYQLFKQAKDSLSCYFAALLSALLLPLPQLLLSILLGGVISEAGSTGTVDLFKALA